MDTRPIKREVNQSLHIKTNKTKVNNSKQSLKCQTGQNIKICRICLQEEDLKSERNDSLIKPCMCAGSLEYIHETCMLEWVNRLIQNGNQKRDKLSNVSCEICKKSLQLKISKRFACQNAKEIKNRVSKFKTVFLIYVCFIFIIASALGVLVYLQIGKGSQTKQASSNVVMKIGWAVLSTLMILWIGKFIWTFFIKIQRYVAKIIPASIKLEIKPRKQQKMSSSSVSRTKICQDDHKLENRQTYHTEESVPTNSSLGNLNHEIIGHQKL